MDDEYFFVCGYKVHGDGEHGAYGIMFNDELPNLRFSRQSLSDVGIQIGDPPYLLSLVLRNVGYYFIEDFAAKGKTTTSNYPHIFKNVRVSNIGLSVEICLSPHFRRIVSVFEFIRARDDVYPVVEGGNFSCWLWLIGEDARMIYNTVKALNIIFREMSCAYTSE
jgi:hypothetical protein